MALDFIGSRSEQLQKQGNTEEASILKCCAGANDQFS
jgi:hypothetical protein